MEYLPLLLVPGLRLPGHEELPQRVVLAGLLAGVDHREAAVLLRDVLVRPVARALGRAALHLLQSQHVNRAH